MNRIPRLLAILVSGLMLVALAPATNAFADPPDSGCGNDRTAWTSAQFTWTTTANGRKTYHAVATHAYGLAYIGSFDFDNFERTGSDALVWSVSDSTVTVAANTAPTEVRATLAKPACNANHRVTSAIVSVDGAAPIAVDVTYRACGGALADLAGNTYKAAGGSGPPFDSVTFNSNGTVTLVLYGTSVTEAVTVGAVTVRRNDVSPPADVVRDTQFAYWYYQQRRYDVINVFCDDAVTQSTPASFYIGAWQYKISAPRPD